MFIRTRQRKLVVCSWKETHPGGSPKSSPMEGAGTALTKGPCRAPGAITQQFQLKQHETKESSISIRGINTYSLLRAHQLKVFIYIIMNI